MASSNRPTPAALGLLAGSSAALTGLAVYQWLELLALRSGSAPACAVNDTINCATVWNTAAAGWVHATLGMPIAALGVIYGGVGLGLTGLLWWASQPGREPGPFLAAVRLWSALGLASCLVFAGIGLQAGAVCLTCMGTYALTAAYAFGAFRLLPPPWFSDSGQVATGSAWALVLATPLYLGLLVPGGQTPRADTLPLVAAPQGEAMTLAQYSASIAALPERDKLQLSYARAAWLAAPALDNSAYPVRARQGPATAPVRVVDFTDIICGHCRIFDGMAEELLRAAPPGSLSVEARHYPLDGECNPDVGAVRGDGVRCLAAKVQICLEQSLAFQPVRHALFENQERLTRELVLDLASRGSGQSADALLACAASADTTARLRQDIEYARRYRIEGTPLVLVNDKECPPVPSLILGLALTRGDANAPAFASLPPPPRE